MSTVFTEYHYNGMISKTFAVYQLLLTFASCKIGKTITEVTVRLSKAPEQAMKLIRLLVKLVTNKLSMTL
eukprot:UN02724